MDKFEEINQSLIQKIDDQASPVPLSLQNKPEKELPSTQPETVQNKTDDTIQNNTSTTRPSELTLRFNTYAEAKNELSAIKHSGENKVVTIGQLFDYNSVDHDAYDISDRTRLFTLDEINDNNTFKFAKTKNGKLIFEMSDDEKLTHVNPTENGLEFNLTNHETGETRTITLNGDIKPEHVFVTKERYTIENEIENKGVTIVDDYDVTKMGCLADHESWLDAKKDVHDTGVDLQNSLSAKFASLDKTNNNKNDITKEDAQALKADLLDALEKNDIDLTEDQVVNILRTAYKEWHNETVMEHSETAVELATPQEEQPAAEPIVPALGA